MDEDLAARCTEVIRKRDIEAEVLYGVVTDDVSMQIEALDTACQRATLFYMRVAMDVEAHNKNKEEIDAKMAEDLEDLKLDFEDAHDEREAKVADTTKQVSQSVESTNPESTQMHRCTSAQCSCTTASDAQMQMQNAKCQRFAPTNQH